MSHQNLSLFTELFALGLNPIPVIWDIPNKIVSKYPEHGDDATDGIPNIEDVKRWLNNGFKDFNGIALKLFPPFGMLDFDLKNTENKNLYKDWFKIVSNTNPDVLSKLCIETTRSGGYHVYIKYSKLTHKIPVARNPQGHEVISVYTGGLLSFCAPSPNYQIIHNEFVDLQELTDTEYHLLVSTAAMFNECEEYKPGQSKVAVIDYPTEYENMCLQFDEKIDDDTYESLLNAISLYRLKDQRLFNRKKYLGYLREGSNAQYSAKVYFSSRRLLIFSASMVDFPTWHDSAKAGDNTWSLTPSKIIFYKNKRNWADTIDEIQMICDSANIDITKPDITQQNIIPVDRLKFPFDIFPDRVQNFIRFQSIQHEYLAGALLASFSTIVGNTAVLEAKDGYRIKPVLYMAIIAPPGAAKTPALKIAFAPIEEYDDELFKQYGKQKEEYAKLLALYEKDKKASDKPEQPTMPQTLIKDSTIEMVIKILSCNPLGCGVLADELSGFLKRMNQYKAGDEVQKWLELWSGAPVLMQRISRPENKVNDPFCTVVGGIQPGVLESLSKEENEHNGFFHRFLFVYPAPNPKTNWEIEETPWIVKNEFYTFFAELLYPRKKFTGDKSNYRLSAEANNLYGGWFNYKNTKYNKSENDHVKGIIAKYQDYCLRFALLLQVIEDGINRRDIVTEISMEKAIRLTEYFLGNMHKAIKLLVPDTPIDKLKPQHLNIYNELPEMFTTKTAISIAERHGMTAGGTKMFLKRYINKIFNQTQTGEYQKIY